MAGEAVEKKGPSGTKTKNHAVVNRASWITWGVEKWKNSELHTCPV